MTNDRLPAACSEAEALRLLNWSSRRVGELRQSVSHTQLQRGLVYDKRAVLELRDRPTQLTNRALTPDFRPVQLHTR
jgi:hypothetical protein